MLHKSGISSSKWPIPRQVDVRKDLQTKRAHGEDCMCRFNPKRHIKSSVAQSVLLNMLNVRLVECMVVKPTDGESLHGEPVKTQGRVQRVSESFLP